jgi:hypothetical protein
MALKRATYSRLPSGKCDAPASREAWRLCDEALGVSPSETASSADLGGSSKYSNENFED